VGPFELVARSRARLMKVHHIAAGAMCPLGRRFIQGEGSFFEPARMICHVLVVETSSRFAIVDTGFGLADIADPKGRLVHAFSAHDPSDLARFVG
jgi:hypothetical protein